MHVFAGKIEADSGSSNAWVMILIRKYCLFSRWGFYAIDTFSNLASGAFDCDLLWKDVLIQSGAGL